jgi:hypothetical protein
MKKLELPKDARLVDHVKFEVIFWTITGLCATYLIPWLIIAYLNPFWFREQLQDAFSHHIDSLTQWRATKLKPIVNKYRTFDILKEA